MKNRIVSEKAKAQMSISAKKRFEREDKTGPFQGKNIQKSLWLF